jgi:ferredoxin-thioredoxin reductase catalytic subunit
LTTEERVRQRAESDANSRGYNLNPDPESLKSLLEGLKQNEERYGYPACPCRLASGKFEYDRDIICPCDYRDPDIEEYGYCYCALYVRKDIFEGKTPIKPIPERRPTEKQVKAYAVSGEATVEKKSKRSDAFIEKPSEARMKMWYCKQCGYVCFREEPPYVCPICKAKKEMFAEIAIRKDSHR